MSEILISLAVEDDLSEAVLRDILKDRPVRYLIGDVYKKDGFGFLKSRCLAFNSLANGCPVLLLTDLDDLECAPSLIEDWFPRYQHDRHFDFLFRVAVREVEAWLLANDREIKRFLGVRSEVYFPDPESLADPKRELLLLAEKSSHRRIREGIVRINRDGNRQQGPGYNSTLIPFLESWSLERAAERCSSLQRLLMALDDLEKRKSVV